MPDVIPMISSNDDLDELGSSSDGLIRLPIDNRISEGTTDINLQS